MRKIVNYALVGLLAVIPYLELSCSKPPTSNPAPTGLKARVNEEVLKDGRLEIILEGPPLQTAEITDNKGKRIPLFTNGLPTGQNNIFPGKEGYQRDWNSCWLYTGGLANSDTIGIARTTARITGGDISIAGKCTDDMIHTAVTDLNIGPNYPIYTQFTGMAKDGKTLTLDLAKYYSSSQPASSPASQEYSTK